MSIVLIPLVWDQPERSKKGPTHRSCPDKAQGQAETFPFGARTTLNLLRGLTVLAFPVAAAAGVFLADRPRAARAVLVASAVWALGCAWLALPGSCHREPVDWVQQDRLVVDRCTFRWAVTAPR